jgi:uncharacterized integral membrane protein (TIGR00698 family)
MNKILIFTVALIICFFQLPPHWSILLGIGITFILTFSHQELGFIKNGSGKILQLSIILLGASLNFHNVINQGSHNIIVTFVSISVVMILGFFLGKVLKIHSPLVNLISSGTAICGGSAIGAVGPAINADNLSIAISLGIVFLLNALSIFILPSIGTFLELSQNQFGEWAALAIHDTSAVVAASSLYGEKALQVATTLKLTRALWIIPLTLLLTGLNQTKSKIKYPWFIGYFILLSFIFTMTSEIQFLIPSLKIISKTGFSLSLFLIGLSLSKSQLKTIQMKTVLFGVILWLLTLVSSYVYVEHFI